MTASSSPAGRVSGLVFTENAPIGTWFGVGGCAERFAEIATEDDLGACLRVDPALRVLGDGANLLVHDRGVAGLVVSMTGAFRGVALDPGGAVTAGAGARLPQLINACVRAGLAGVEGLVGIPASMGGAVVMNAGGGFGSMADVVRRVRVMDRDTGTRWIDADMLGFGYRKSVFSGSDHGGPIVLAVEMTLTPDDPGACRERQMACMDRKKSTQPLRDSSAGCCFKNPTLTGAVDGIGDAGDRVSAGLLIDRAGGKGLRVGAAAVSDRHANFIVTEGGATASDVIELMDRVAALVHGRFGVELEREVVVWGTP